MKKSIIALFLLFASFNLVACSSSEESNTTTTINETETTS